MPKIKEPYIIAETAYNHEGNINYLYQMIDDIAELQLNAVKVHLLLNPESYMTPNHPLFSELKKWVFSEKQWDNLINYMNKKRLDIIALCDDAESIQYLLRKKKKINAIELHATGLNDFYLLREACNFDGKIILGIGGSTIDEISYAVDSLKRKNKDDIILMYGFQSYPTDYANINLARMMKLQNLFQLPIGYADHTGFDDPFNELVSVSAAIMGFNILEKHYTLDFGKERIDFHAAAGRQQMKKIKELMKIALMIYGNGNILLSESEKIYSNIGPMKKAIVARKSIKKGEKLKLDYLWFKRTNEESTISQNHLLQIIGLKTTQDIAVDEIIDYSKLEYSFKKRKLKDFTYKGKDK